MSENTSSAATPVEGGPNPNSKSAGELHGNPLPYIKSCLLNEIYVVVARSEERGETVGEGG